MTYTLHISLYDAAFFAMLVTGIVFVLQLWFKKDGNRAANRYLSLALLSMVLWLAGIIGADLKFWVQTPHFLLAYGPFVYLYARNATHPENRFRAKYLFHFIPVLLVPVMNFPVLALTSVTVYLFLSYRLIQRFYRELKFTDGDRTRQEWRWLERLIGAVGLAALLGWPLLLALMILGMGVVVYFRPEKTFTPLNSSPLSLRRKGGWLKSVVKVERYYLDPELDLSSLAQKLGLHTHELSRIINTALKKNFTDFINEYRVREAARKMHDPAYDHLSLLGIAYESGFNSQSSFSRIFKQATGKSPAEYKNISNKDFPSYKLGRPTMATAVVSHQKIYRNFMIRNYIKIAWRNLLRNKSHSLINIAGLSVGLASGLLILFWVQNEYSVDSFFQHKERLFKIYKTNYDHHVPSGGYEVPGPLADELKRRFPDIEYATSFAFGETSAFQAGEKVAKMNGNAAGADFFKMFSYPLLAGSAQAALSSPEAIAISRNMAEIFYGSAQQAIGKTIRYQNQKDFKVTAVFENLPKNASQSFDFLINWEAFLVNTSWARDMGNNGPTAYVMLRPNANVAAVNANIAHVFDLYYHINRSTANWYADIALQPYADVYLHGDAASGKPAGGRIEYVHLFSIVAVFIMLIACINFMNLSTARSVKRAKEVGVRKVAGALRGSLIRQFLVESLLITSIAVVIALVLVLLLLPEFNQITKKQLNLPFTKSYFWLTITGITLVTGLIAGSYPALFLSAFKPIKVLKTTVKLETGTLFFRKGLVIFQFVLSVVLVTSTLIVSRQMHYLATRDLGYDRENVVYLPIEGTLTTRYAVFKQELLSRPGIASVSRLSSAPVDIYGSSPAVDWTGHDSTMNILFTRAVIGYDYFKTMKLTLLAGREFSIAYPSDSANYILNETALKLTGYKDPIGKPFRYMGRRGTIVGIVKDFHFHSLHDPIGPMVLTSGENANWGVVLVRTQPGKTATALAAIKDLSKTLNPAFPPVVYFVDEQYQLLYQNEQVINQLSHIFAGLAIFISCLGLLGLAMFTAEQRVKEIGIRKVLGAGIGSLFRLLSAEFIMLIGIAIAIALPLSWYATHGWLQGFAYRTSLPWWVFALSAILIVAVALLTISFQIIKAALLNPVKSLRGE